MKINKIQFILLAFFVIVLQSCGEKERLQQYASESTPVNYESTGDKESIDTNEKIETDYIICQGYTLDETAIIAFYQSYCYRCPEREGLDYWLDDINIRGESLTQVGNNINQICVNEIGYLNKTHCERQQMNALYAECPEGYDFLPNHSTACFKTCQ